MKQAENGEVKSYVQDTALAVMDCRETATSREDFIDQMKARGYGVDWKDSHKYITFTDLERQSQGENNVKSATINWKSIMQWTLERRA